MVDITAQKEAEERLRLSNDELEFRVRARTVQLEEANEMMSLEIGERRRVEKEHHDAEERFRHLVEDLPAVVYRRQLTTADDGRDHSYASPQIEDLLGFGTAEWQDEELRTSRIHPHDRDAVVQAWTRCSVTGEPFQMEYRCFHKDGRIVTLFDRATMLSRTAAGEPLLYQGVMIDVTARLDAERKAAEAEARFRELVELGPGVPYNFRIIRGNPIRAEIAYTSPQMEQILKLPPGDWADLESWFDLMHPDDRGWVGERIRSIFERGQPWDIEYRMIAGDGGIVWVEDLGRCIEFDDGGRPLRFQGIVLDITSRHRTEEATAGELSLLRDLIDGMPAIPWSHTVDATTGWTRYLYMGKQCLDLVGYTADELMAEQHHFPRLVHPDDLERVLRTSGEADRTGVWDDEFRLLHRDGSVRWVHGVGRRVTPPGEDPATWHGVTIDVTSRHAPEMSTADPVGGTAGR
jgi:PAS domain S-box-containing protein